MRPPKKEFIVQFPSTSKSFTTSAPTAREFQDALKRGKGSRLMSCWMLADDLMTKTASHREATDMFAQYYFSVRRNLLNMELGLVAKKQEQVQNSGNNRPEWKGFLDFRLDANQLAELDDWKPKPVDIWIAVDSCIQAGYRFTLSYNKGTKIATCTIIDDEATRKTAGYALASGDTDGASALKMAIYKQVILLDNNWQSLVDSPPVARRG